MKTFTACFGFALLACCIAQVKAQMPNDTLYIDHLRNLSAIEQNVFDKVKTRNEFDPLIAFLMLDSGITEQQISVVRSSLDKIYAQLDKKVELNKDDEKSIQNIFKTVHASLLNKYDIKTNFRQIFQSGEYNCVTGSALYGIVFSHYNIPFVVKEAPTHVYLVVDPNGKKIKIETTDPSGGYFSADERFKKNYVNYLVESKLVSSSELASSGYDEVFNKNYYAKDEISLKQLAGLHYYNDGLGYVEKQNYKKAVQQFEKAYTLYPCKRISYLLYFSALEAQVGADYDNDEAIDNFINLKNYSSGNRNNDMMLDEFRSITEKYLVNVNKPVRYDTIYNRIRRGIPDTLFERKLDDIYYSEEGRIAVLKGEYKKSLEYLQKALEINPDNVQNRSLMVSSMFYGLAGSNDYNKIIKDLDANCIKYEFLKSNNLVLKAYSECYLRMAVGKINRGDVREGLQNLSKLESLKKNNDIELNEELIGLAYGEASAYYVRANDYKSARALLNRGLAVSPYNEILNRKLRVLNEAKK